MTARFHVKLTGMRRFISVLLTALVLSSSTVAFAREPILYDTVYLDARYDWVIFFEPNQLDDVDYRGSNFLPGTNITVRYRINPRLAKNHEDKTYHYEDLWYHGATPIGLRRFMKLGLQPQWQGVICIASTDYADEHTDSIANAAIRLMLDVCLSGDILVAVLSPKATEEKICADLGRFNFFKTTDDSLGIGMAGIHLLLSTGDSNSRIFMLYKP
jgi:hypothetical protein